jgi:hypothetical protein
MGNRNSAPTATPVDPVARLTTSIDNLADHITQLQQQKQATEQECRQRYAQFIAEQDATTRAGNLSMLRLLAQRYRRQTALIDREAVMVVELMIRREELLDARRAIQQNGARMAGTTAQ